MYFVTENEHRLPSIKAETKCHMIGYKQSYIHKLTPFSNEGRQKLQKATCYEPYRILSPRPHSVLHTRRLRGLQTLPFSRT